MAMPVQHVPAKRWTEEEFYAARDAAPQGERWELVDGEVLVTPSPHWTHQGIVVRLVGQIDAYIRGLALGRVFTAPLDVRLQPGIVLQPDVLVVPRDELLHGEPIRRLLLAVECLSPSSARHDRVKKRPVYQRNRVPEYWIIDGEAQVIERWQPDDERPSIIADRLRWMPERAAEAFELDLPEFFRGAAAID